MPNKKLEEHLMAEAFRCKGQFADWKMIGGKTFSVFFDVVEGVGLRFRGNFNLPVHFTGGIEFDGAGYVINYTDEFERSTIEGTASKYFEEMNLEIIEGYLIPNGLI